MWQLSFAESDASRAAAFAALPPDALTTEALALCGSWHDPVPALLRASVPGVTWATMLCDHGETAADVGYMPGKLRPGSVELRRWEVGGAGSGSSSSTSLAPPLPPLACVTLLGDAAHPMSPFKGQGVCACMLYIWRLCCGACALLLVSMS
jgi:hypothetical protein